MSQHYTRRFLEAFARVQASSDPKTTFRDEMVAIGHVERVRNLYRVRDKRSSRVDFFHPNDAQEEYLSELPRRAIILKTRQLGFTTLIGIRELDKALFEPNFHSGIMAHKDKAVKGLFEKVIKFPYKHFVKDWGHLYNPVLKNDNTTALFFEHDGLGRDLSSSVTVAFEFRSGTLNILHKSEAAFITNDRLAASEQTVPDTGESIGETTPNGRGGDFFEQWQNWKKLGTLAPYRGFFFPWFKHYPEDRTEPRWRLPAGAELTDAERELKQLYKLDEVALAWRRYAIAALCQGDVDTFNREYPTDDESCFYSGESLVFPSSVTQAQNKFTRPFLKRGFLYSEGSGVSKFQSDPAGFLTIWEEPDPLSAYSIGVDPSQGVGRDRGAVYVLNQSNGRLVARIHSQLSPEDLAGEVIKLAYHYNKAWICVERNNHGHLLLYVMRQKNYPHLYRTRDLDAATGEEKEEYGFLTNNQSKLTLTERFKNACRSGAVQILDTDLITEMTTFVQVSGKMGSIKREASPGNHDDLIIAACLAWEQNLARPVTTYQSEPLVAAPEGQSVQYDSMGFPTFYDRE